MRGIMLSAVLGLGLAVAGAIFVWPGGSTGAETLPCSGGDVSASAVQTFESVVVWDGKATAAGDSHSARFCGEDSMGLRIIVNWNGKKDLRLTVVDPNGNTYVSDNHSGTSYEYMLFGSNLPHGDWTVSVSNNDRGSTSYSASLEFR